MDIREILVAAAGSNASDIFVAAGKKPCIRRFGKLEFVADEEIQSPVIDAFRSEVLLQPAREYYLEHGNFDAGLSLDGNLRFRINFHMQQGRSAFTARPVPLAESLDFESLNLPPVVKKFAESPRGLILVAGTASSGKSTTMATIINHINSNYDRHIVCIEDPVEFIHSDGKSIITQREVGTDTSSFGEALKNIVRESPDVIVIGEMRDLETMQTAINAALTGHLIITTIHTSDTIQSIERIINHYPEHLRAQAADDLSLALTGVIAQRLIPTKNGSGLIPALEILMMTPYVRSLIAARNFRELEEAIKRGHEEGMVTFTRAISELCKKGSISFEDAALAATNKDEFNLLVHGMESGIETFRNDRDAENDGDGRVNMKRLLQSAVSNMASDLILTAGCQPCVRIDGEITFLDTDELSPADTKRLLFSIITPRQRALFEENRELDFALTVNIKRSKAKNREQTHRFRINAFHQRGNIAVAARIIPQKIPAPEELGIPMSVVKLADRKQGLILVTGPTGHGKSTTLASLIDRINQNRACHIITVEDPIEYVHQNSKSVVEQREVHSDTISFSNALKYVLRQDPDVILIGEMRDPETMAAALTAAETGHLVMATLHTNSAAQSINRIIDSFPAHQQNQIRLQLSMTLLGIISQRLLPRKDGKGRVPAFEILTGSHGARSLIREGKAHQIEQVIETSAKEGMITMRKAVLNLAKNNIITRETMESLIDSRDLE